MPRHSPFPGLDPYLEAHWGDVHQRLILYSGDVLQDRLPDDLLARVEERVYVEDDDTRLRRIHPDVRILEWHPDGRSGVAVAEAGGVAVAEPRILLVEADETTEGWLEIREADGGRVVTVIEFLSPANKAGGEGSRQYRQKQRQVLQSDASLVEIDLVRSGNRVLAVSEYAFPDEWRRCAQACICRGWQKSQREYYGFPMRARLPSLAIPLRPQDPPIALDLQAILDQCYAKGRYDRIDYARDPEPPLSAEDAAWARELLAAAGLRPA